MFIHYTATLYTLDRAHRSLLLRPREWLGHDARDPPDQALHQGRAPLVDPFLNIAHRVAGTLGLLVVRHGGQTGTQSPDQAAEVLEIGQYSEQDRGQLVPELLVDLLVELGLARLEIGVVESGQDQLYGVHVDQAEHDRVGNGVLALSGTAFRHNLVTLNNSILKIIKSIDFYSCSIFYIAATFYMYIIGTFSVSSKNVAIYIHSRD